MKQMRTYKAARELLRSIEALGLKGDLGDQIDRAARSVCLNLMEGSGRLGNDRLKFFRYAYGSIKEVYGCLDLIDSPLIEVADGIAGGIYKLMKNPGRGF